MKPLISTLVALGLILWGSACIGQVETLYAIRQFSYSSNRLFEYQELPIQWTMAGKIQLHLNEGINNLSDQSLSAAEANLSEVIVQDPKVWPAYYYRSICYKQTQQMDRAKNDLLFLIEKFQPQYEYFIELGKISHLMGTHKEAIKYFENAIKIKPNDALAYFLLGNVQLEKLRFAESRSNYKICLNIDPSFHDAQIKLGIVDMISSKKIEEGLPYFDKVISEDSLNRSALILRSTIKVERGDLDIRDLDRLVRISPENIMVRFMRARVLTKQKKYSVAFSDLQKVFKATYQDENVFVGQQTELDKRIDLQSAGEYTVRNVYGLPDEDGEKIRKAFCLIVTKDYDEAFQTIEGIFNWNKNALCLFLLGLASEHSGKHANAFNFYDHALRVDNDIADAHKKRGVYKTELKKWQEAMFDFSEILRISPSTFVAYKLRGLTQYHQKNFHLAIEDFSAYLKYDSLNKEVLNFRGITHLALGDSIRATSDFAQGENRDMLVEKDIVKFCKRLIVKHDTSQALQYLSITIKARPDFGELHVLRLRLMAAQKNWVILPSALEAAVNSLGSKYWTKENASFLALVRGMILANVKNYPAALVAFDEAASNNDRDGRVFLERGLTLLELQRVKDAINDLKKAEKLGQPLATKLLASIVSQKK